MRGYAVKGVGHEYLQPGLRVIRAKGSGNKDNHGQVVSECNHRANERNLKGQERKEWTEWCEERGSRYNYNYKRYSSDRNCYQQADNEGLTGDKRRKFINDCLDIPNKR